MDFHPLNNVSATLKALGHDLYRAISAATPKFSQSPV
jgi:hypothetical protein